MGNIHESQNLYLCFDRFYSLYRSQTSHVAQTIGLYAGQPPILEYIGNHPGCTQVEIAESLGISSASVAASTKRMQKKGLIGKQVDRDNLRCNKLTITEKGTALKDRFHAEMTQAIDKALAGLDEADLEILRKCMTHIISNSE